jgi:hypothetical protein
VFGYFQISLKLKYIVDCEPAVSGCPLVGVITGCWLCAPGHRGSCPFCWVRKVMNASV